jgi:uncharacterized protein (TIGR02996 family)
MDLLSQHEAFLRAIFDAPDDDTPRLVYADFLEENGEPERAELIRVQCELSRLPPYDAEPQHSERRFQLLTRQAVLLSKNLLPVWRDRGFPAREYHVTLEGNDLRDLLSLRRRLVRDDPHWFGVTSLGVRAQPPLDPARVDALFSLLAFARVTTLDLRGSHSEEEDPQGNGILSVYVTYPTIGLPGVHALAANKGMRRITALVLSNNDLDNDAARALVNSPYLDNLKRLELFEGNRFRGRVWQQVIERFGEDVVG